MCLYGKLTKDYLSIITMETMYNKNDVNGNPLPISTTTSNASIPFICNWAKNQHFFVSLSSGLYARCQGHNPNFMLKSTEHEF